MHAILIATAALVGLPILLHLIMKQEPKRLPFPALRFLQIRRKTNQRKMKLRHFLLLALRMLLIGLFGVAIFQPILPSTGLDFGITLASEQSVAAVVVLDTSPSMGYLSGGQSRLSEAKRRALELLDDLPPSSRVAVLDPAEPGGTWEQSLSDARRRIEAMKEPHGVAVPVTTALSAAYSLLRSLETESEPSEPLPRLIAVFSDRTTACWDAARVADLIKSRDLVPPPPVAHLFVDVGVDQPTDVAIASIELKPQVVPQGQAVVLNATLTTTGPGVETTIKCKVFPASEITATLPEQTKLAVIPANGSSGVSFTLPADALKPGLYQAELRLETLDNLLFDNVRYISFKIAEPRKILTISDDPAEASFWRLAHQAKGEFDCEVQSSLPDNLAKYEAIALLNVTDPSRYWPRLLEYVDAGGKLLILPGGEAQVHLPAYRPDSSEAAARLLPAALKEVFDTKTLPDAKQQGVPWRLDDDALRHPFFGPFREWKLRGNVDVVERPRIAWKYWDAIPTPESTVVARFADADETVKSRPAIIEKSVGPKGGRVLLLTTRIDTPPDDRQQHWNNYWDFDSSWPTVIPNLFMRYLAGDPTDVVLNFTTGQAVPLPLPRGGVARLQIEGPGVTVRDADIGVNAQQSDFRLPSHRTGTAGNFRLFTPDRSWIDGFSLNPIPEECSLAKVPVEAIEALLGTGSVVPVDRKLSLRDVLKLKYDQPLELFPWLLMLVLLVLALEGYIANRFYRSR